MFDRGEAVAEVARELDVRSGTRPADQGAAPRAFDPRLLIDGAFGREYATALARETQEQRAAAVQALDRLGASDYPAAIAGFDARLSSTPADARAAFFLGWSYHGAGDERQAITAWRRAAFLDPRAVPAHLALADAYIRLGQPALAIQALRAGLSALPQSPELIDRLASLGQKP